MQGTFPVYGMILYSKFRAKYLHGVYIYYNEIEGCELRNSAIFHRAGTGS